jgi:hypothetical protein
MFDQSSTKVQLVSNNVVANDCDGQHYEATMNSTVMVGNNAMNVALQLAMLQSPMCSDGVTKKFIFLLDSVKFKTSCVFMCM